MKRLLTYGLLLLTILASHFVVSACQDDSDKTTIIMTFTTRIDNTPQSTTPGEEAEVEVEQMKELRIIMAREDGTVIVNAEDYNVEDNPYSFSFNVPMMTYTERFQFIVIANESTLVSSIDLASIDDKDEFNNLKTCVIGQDGFSLGASQYIPQTIYWTQEITYGETTNIKKELLFVVGKITVEFENQTEEAQSLSDIHIKGIIPNAQGYLLAQASNDFVGTQHGASAMQDADIIFNPVTNLSVGGSSPIQHYYTYPVGTGGIASANLLFTQSDKQYMQPTLFATWNGIEYNLPITEVRDEEGNVHNFTSLARNERLKIVITLTPAGDITVNYTIHSWVENQTNIGDTAPTIPGNTPGNGNDYYVDNWGTGGIIDVGGGGNDDPWANLGGTIVAGGNAFSNWAEVENLETNYVDLVIKGEYLKVDFGIAIEFTSLHPENECSLRFCTPWTHYFSDKFYFSGEGKKVITYIFDEEAIKLIAKHNNEDQSTSIIVTDDYIIYVDTDLEVVNGQSNSNIVIHRMAIIDTN